MSAIHEALYKADSSINIDIRKYLSNISETLIRSYKTETEVGFRINCERLMVNTKYASPLRLIINELMRNTLKYAFVEKDAAEIRMSVNFSDNMLTLSYADTGVGIPKNLDWRNASTLGLKLIIELVEQQLGGAINLNDETRSESTSRFPLELQ